MMLQWPWAKLEWRAVCAERCKYGSGRRSASALLTPLRIAAGFCYLAVILDACSRKVVGYGLSKRLDTPLALAALRSALDNRKPPPGCIHHTDRGCQYASETYRRALDAAGLQGSMSAVGNPYHNAQAESFMKTLKVEDVYIVGYGACRKFLWLTCC